MPRKEIAELESRWVPIQARCVCYQCGSHLPNDDSKDNCRLCFDVFCLSCLQEKTSLPSSYGYHVPQEVCKMCALLLKIFPTFTSKLHTGMGGMLIPPGIGAIVTACHLPFYPGACRGSSHVTSSSSRNKVSNEMRNDNNMLESSGSAKDKRSSGRFSIFNRLRGKDKEKAVEIIDGGTSPECDPPISYITKPIEEIFGNRLNNSANEDLNGNVGDRSSMATPESLTTENTVELFMTGWRPMNPSTRIQVGDSISILIQDILRVSCGSGRTKGKSVSDGRVSIYLRNGGYVQLVIGVVTSSRDNDDIKIKLKCDSDEEDSSVYRCVEFVTDPNEASRLVDNIDKLTKECKLHFAFGRASIALHKDMCPAMQTRDHGEV
eukprot:Tbor_TRINITY_DN3390_c0_g1::TRINITY_DN3390_c0_g1_i1::g.23505::m.23505